MRAFLCVPLPEDAKAAVAAVSERLRSAVLSRALWVAQPNYHVTVRFLGDIDPMATVALRDAAVDAARDGARFDLVLNRVGAFPDADRARVLWVGGETPNRFRRLVDGLNRRLEGLGYPAERRRAQAHVTVARIKDHPKPVALPTGVPTIRVPVQEIVLMESRLTQRGAIYDALFRVPID